MKFWRGSKQEACQLCSAALPETTGTVFYDTCLAATHWRWAVVCNTCFVRGGGRLGTGRGQKYRFEGREAGAPTGTVVLRWWDVTAEALAVTPPAESKPRPTYADVMRRECGPVIDVLDGWE